MTRLFAQWRQVHAEYRKIKSLRDDLADLGTAIVATLGILAWTVVCLFDGTIAASIISEIFGGTFHG